VISLARQFKQMLRPETRRKRFGAAEVHAFLRGGANGIDPETDEMRRMIERLPVILREPGVRKRYDGFQRYFDVLPRILFLYHRGTPVARIAEDLSFLATEVGVETVIWITSQIVAERLNQVS
jgi:hypothetical protein